MSPTVRANHLVARYATNVRDSSVGIGGRLDAFLTRARTVRLGSVTVHDVEMALDVTSAGAMADPSIIANVGLPVLARFVIVLDYRGRAMYLQPLR